MVRQLIRALYTFYFELENRLARQYLNTEDTQRINGMMKKGIAPVR